MALPSDLGHLFDFSELKAAGGAVGDTGRFQALVYAVHAVIAFFHFSGLLVPLGRPPGTGGDAGFTSYTKIFIYKHNAVLAALLHGTGGAGRDTPGIFTMEAGHENKRGPGNLAYSFRPHLDDLAGSWTGRQFLIGLAHHLAGVAADTFSGILKQVVVTHVSSGVWLKTFIGLFNIAITMPWEVPLPPISFNRLK